MDFKCKFAAWMVIWVLIDFSGQLNVNGLDCPICLHKKGEQGDCAPLPCNAPADMGESEKKFDADKQKLLKSQGKADPDAEKVQAEGAPAPEEMTKEMAEMAKRAGDTEYVCYKGVGNLKAEVGAPKDGKGQGTVEDLPDIEFQSCGLRTDEHKTDGIFKETTLKLAGSGFAFTGELTVKGGSGASKPAGDGGNGTSKSAIGKESIPILLATGIITLLLSSTYSLKL